MIFKGKVDFRNRPQYNSEGLITENEVDIIQTTLQDQIDDIILTLQNNGIYIGEISFETSGATFAPVIILSDTATVLWTFDDGTTSDSTTPNKDFGTPGSRTQRLKVTPWSHVYRINIGYDGADGGAGDIELIPQQNVTEIKNMFLVADTLVDFCGNHNPITNVNLDNFISLDTIELYGSDLVSISIKNTPLLQRLQVESTDLAVLDLTETPNLGDIRASSNPYTAVDWGTGLFDNLWHICMRDTAGSYRIIYPIPANMPNIEDLYIWNTNQVGAGDYSNLSSLIRGRFQNNDFTSLDFTNSFVPGSSLSADSNQLTSIILTGCGGLDTINLTDNNFGQTAIDYIYITMDSLGGLNGEINTTGGTNTYPSPAGVTAIANLEGKGWVCLYTAVPPPTEPELNTVTIAANGTDWTFGFSEIVVFGAGGNAGFAVTMSIGGAINLTYVSGAGTESLVYSGDVTINSGETVTSGLDYTQPGDGIEDTEGNDLVTLTNHAVINNSTQGASGITYINSAEAEFDPGAHVSRITTSMTFIVGNVVCVCCQGWTRSVTGNVTDSLGNTYTLVDTEVIVGSMRTSWYQSVITNGGDGTISVSFDNEGRYCSIGALQFSGINTSSVVGTNPVGSTGESVDVTTTTGNEVILFGGHNDAGPAVAYTVIPVEGVLVLENLEQSYTQGRTMGYWILIAAQTNTPVGCTAQAGTNYSMGALSLNGV